jgi:hypothetical protein
MIEMKPDLNTAALTGTLQVLLRRSGGGLVPGSAILPRVRHARIVATRPPASNGIFFA